MRALWSVFTLCVRLFAAVRAVLHPSRAHNREDGQWVVFNRQRRAWSPLWQCPARLGSLVSPSV